jgi:hypothetical protein
MNHIRNDVNMHQKGPMCHAMKTYFQQPYTFEKAARQGQCMGMNELTLPCYYLNIEEDCERFLEMAAGTKDMTDTKGGWVSKPATKGGHNSKGIMFWGKLFCTLKSSLRSACGVVKVK